MLAMLGGYKSNKYKAGFTILEVCIVLMIFSALLAVGWHSYDGIIAVEGRKDTEIRLEAVKKDLVLYYKMHKKLPCPAPYNVPSSDASFGVPVGDCNVACGHANLANHFGCEDNVVSGMLPIKALYLSDVAIEPSLDAWGNRIRYVVDKRFTSSSTQLTSFAGDITISTINTAGAETEIAGASAMGGVVFALIGHGRNGYGAWRDARNAIEAPCASGSATETNNCSGKKKIYYVDEHKRHIGDYSAAAAYDDVVVWESRDNLQ